MPDATDTLIRPQGNDAASDSDTPDKTPGYLGLSLTQILGGALAAVSAAALGARLGLAGTLSGAAIGSMVSAVAAAAYTESLRRTRTVIRTRTLTAVAGARTVAVVADAETDEDGSPLLTRASDREWRPTRAGDRALGRRIALGAAALFAGVLVLITGIELGMGRALDGQSGTTVRQVVEKAGTGKAGSTKPVVPSSSSTSDSPASSPSDSPTSQTPGTSTDTPTTSTDTPTTSTDTPTTSTEAPSTPTDPGTPDATGTDAATPNVEGGLDPLSDPSPALP
ncbi:MAG TPA: hypothetical protein PKH97_08855 [Tetrasphaera sp.]|uniref:hypothetical protein n=1 Tax=Nostocoides sp. TaxID=1917966 RepID=UPI002CF24E22|nr:hypothetical protein [Tetrasphaera sp.]HNQ07278.1 hypothetical protein [Tetrasphaera sp.]